MIANGRNRVRHRLLKRIVAVALVALAGAGANAAVDQDEIDWVRQNAFVLDAVEFVDGHANLLSLLPLFEGARIVALGEGTHGTREFFTVRLRLMELLATELDFNAFAFEFPYGEGVEVNEYIRNGNGDPAEILARVYCPPWNHEEMLSLIEWMRVYNATPGRARPLTFHGIDVHDGSSVLLIDSLLRFIEGVDEIAEDRARYAGPSADAYETALHEARVLHQRAEFYALMSEDPEAATDLRDSYMAENLVWLEESLGSSGRIVVGAHNYHVGRFKDHVYVAGIETRTQTAMGWHLSERYGDEYVVLATTTRAGDVAIFPFPGSAVVDLLRAAEVSPCVLDLRIEEATSATNWLFEDRALLHFGTVFVSSTSTSYMIQQPIAELFDLLLYIDRTSAPHMLPWTPWQELE